MGNLLDFFIIYAIFPSRKEWFLDVGTQGNNIGGVMSNEASATKVGVFEEARLAFSGGSSYTQEPSSPLEKGDNLIGVLKDSVVRNFYSLSCGFADQFKAGMEEHRTLHILQGTHNSAECQRLCEQHKLMKHGADIFSQLFWEGVAVTFPSSGGGWGVRKKWRVVSLKSDNEVDNSVYEGKFLTFFSDLRRAMLIEDEKSLNFSQLVLDPMDHENEEFRIGVITSPALKALYLIQQDLQKRLKDIIRKDMTMTVLPEGKNPIQVIEGVVNKARRLKGQLSLVDDLFWVGVREIYPKVDEHNNIGIRKDWTIVHVPTDEDPIQELIGLLSKLAHNLE